MWLLDRLFKRSIIICIHGLANKPPRDILSQWWKESIIEGFDTIGFKKKRFNYAFVYWADLMHEEPLDPAVTDEKSELFLDNPYRKGDPSKYRDFTPSSLKKKVLEKLEKKMDKAFFEEKTFFNYDKLSDVLIKSLFKDLDYYYNKDCPVVRYRGLNAKKEIRERLASTLRKHRHKKILLVAHSMGTIISYDVMTRTVPDIPIHTLITIGSPLGLPVVIKRICQESGQDHAKDQMPPAPESITQGWYNFSDLDDKVAINFTLADDFKKNSRGVGPADAVILNNYEKKGKKDAHNSYGYCRAPEVAQAIRRFLES